MESDAMRVISVLLNNFSRHWKQWNMTWVVCLLAFCDYPQTSISSGHQVFRVQKFQVGIHQPGKTTEQENVFYMLQSFY